MPNANWLPTASAFGTSTKPITRVLEHFGAIPPTILELDLRSIEQKRD